MLVIFCKAEAIRLSNFNAQKCFCQSATGLMPSDIPHVPAFAQHAHGDNHAHLPCFFPQASVFGIQSFGAAPRPSRNAFLFSPSSCLLCTSRSSSRL